MKRNKCEEGIDGFGFEFVLMISQDCNHTFLSEAEVPDKILCFGDNFGSDYFHNFGKLSFDIGIRFYYLSFFTN